MMMDSLKIGPHSPPSKVHGSLSVGGGTTISVHRRTLDARFATRWLVGVGLDIGGGTDSIGLHMELFPGMRKVIVYDREQGDAMTLENVESDGFDFVYSSHCLEHVENPFEALGNWIRVVKPGGYLVVSVPDEDLYEQGVWPSRFNGDHKTSWTILKQVSWSPVSRNVLDLVAAFRMQVQVLKIELIDHTYRYRLQGQGIDQTRTGSTEAAIEFVLRKL